MFLYVQIHREYLALVPSITTLLPTGMPYVLVPSMNATRSQIPSLHTTALNFEKKRGRGQQAHITKSASLGSATRVMNALFSKEKHSVIPSKQKE